MFMEIHKGWIISLLLVSMFLSLPASGTWSSFRGDEGNTGSVPEELPPGWVLDLSVSWVFHGDGEVVGSVVVNGEHVFFNTMNGTLYILDRESGAEVSNLSLSGRFYNAPALDVSTGRIFEAAGGGEVVCLDPISGMVLWNRSLGDGAAIHSSPALYDDTLIIASYDSNIYCLDPEDGRELWRFEGCGGKVHTTPAFHHENGNDIVVFGSCDGNLYALSRDSGKLLWNFSASYIPSSPAVADDRVIFGSFDGHLRCVDARDGELLWSTDLHSPIFSSPSVLGNMTAVATDDGVLHLVDNGNGSVVWSRELVKGSLETSPVMIGGHVIITSERGLSVLSMEDGGLERGFELGDSSGSSPSVDGGMVFFGDDAGYVRALGPSEENGEGGEAPLDMGEEKDLTRDVIFLAASVIVLIAFFTLVYMGYVRIRSRR
ncbi:hypothetical protein B6U90_07025 [Thermoplasmatales archaeon ex4484_6]|nr:MAG: hypothetical protein B6U90_07025 [Thermoplasmatales archaeon ex4484_6]